MSNCKDFKSINEAVKKACTKEELLFLANLINDLHIDMEITNKEYEELMELLQKKLGD